MTRANQILLITPVPPLLTCGRLAELAEAAEASLEADAEEAADLLGADWLAADAGEAAGEFATVSDGWSAGLSLSGFFLSGEDGDVDWAALPLSGEDESSGLLGSSESLAGSSE